MPMQRAYRIVELKSPDDFSKGLLKTLTKENSNFSLNKGIQSYHEQYITSAFLCKPHLIEIREGFIMKIPAPNYTQTPNVLFDEWLPRLGEVELKVLLVIIRKTFGWHKTRDKISLSQLENLTGSIPKNILKAINGLIEKGLVMKIVEGDPGRQITYYEIVVTTDSNNSYPCRSDRGPPVDSTAPPPVESTVTKETLKIKEKKDDVDRGRAGDSCGNVDKEKPSITKDDVYHACVAQRRDWLPEEIEVAWRTFPNDKKISDPFQYVDSMIKNQRIINEVRKEKCQKISNKKEGSKNPWQIAREHSAATSSGEQVCLGSILLKNKPKK